MLPGKGARRARTAGKPGQMAGKGPDIMQMEALECGAACLAMIAAYYGKWVPLEQVRADCGVSRDGSKASNVVRAARAYGFEASGFRMQPEALRSQGVFPCIVHWNFSHFVVCRGFKGGKVHLNDPARGEVTVTEEEFDAAFTGVMLRFVPGPDFQPSGKPRSVWEFVGPRLQGSRAALAFVAITAAVTAVVGIINPALSQVFMDRLLGGKNPEWLYPFIALLIAVGAVRIVVEVLTGSVAVVDQDIVLFNDTIANNIRLWDTSIEDYEVILAARDAGIHEVIMQRDGGYNAVLSEGGRDLSGGQRQRLEIARVLAQDPTVLIMDEATSALDAKTEQEVMSAVRKRGITCIVVAHRLSTVRDCDEIVVLDKGRVVERGTHEELCERGGMYLQLVTQE